MEESPRISFLNRAGYCPADYFQLQPVLGLPVKLGQIMSACPKGAPSSLIVFLSIGCKSSGYPVQGRHLYSSAHSGRMFPVPFRPACAFRQARLNYSQPAEQGMGISFHSGYCARTPDLVMLP